VTHDDRVAAQAHRAVGLRAGKLAEVRSPGQA
jgi:predicted ABC-type transport system involved in lysophospholipase L1 biosynthesis ATPase subunit